MSTRLAVALHDLGPSQLSFLLISQANKLVAENPTCDIVCLYEELAKPCLAPNFASMHLAEAYGYTGTLVATSVSTAAKILQFPSAKKRIFFVWDLEWLRNPRSFRDYQRVYGDARLQLACRCLDHAVAIRNAWNRNVSVVPDFNLADLGGVS